MHKKFNEQLEKELETTLNNSDESIEKFLEIAEKHNVKVMIKNKNVVELKPKI